MFTIFFSLVIQPALHDAPALELPFDLANLSLTREEVSGPQHKLVTYAQSLQSCSQILSFSRAFHWNLLLVIVAHPDTSFLAALG